MRKNTFFLYLLILLLIVLAGHESFWDGIFSVIKFLAILIALIAITTAIKFLLIYRKLKQTPGSFYSSSTYSSSRQDPRVWRFFYRKNPSYSREESSRTYSSSNLKSPYYEQGKTIEICPNCGYEKGENHVCR